MNKLSIKKQLGGRLRRSLWMACAALCAAPALQAQTTFKSFGFDPISKKFTLSGKPQLLFEAPDGEGLQVYDENLLQLKQINFPKESKYCSHREVIQERQQIEGAYEDNERQTNSHWVNSLEEAVSLAENSGLSSHTKKGNVHKFMPLEVSEEPGTTYTYYKYTENDNWVYEYEVNRIPKFGDWKTVSEETYYGNHSYIEIRDYDDGMICDGCSLVCISQSLFNADEKYEYFLEIYSPATEADTSIVDHVNIWGEQIPVKRRLNYWSKCIGTELLSDDGTVVHTFPGSVWSVVLIAGKCYVVELDNDKGEYTFYEVETKTNSIREAKSMPLRLSPSLARRTDDITVETAPAAASVRREVVVTAADGRLMARQPIPAGETTVRVSAARMTAGVYTFTVVSEGRKLESGRIIVR